MAYDSKAVKVPKQVKRSAAQYIDPHQRGAFIRSYVRILEAETHQRSNKNRKDSKSNGTSI
jgi:hypothetical protein